MSNDKIREEFEVAFAEKFGITSEFIRDSGDKELTQMIGAAWWGWQASRESLVIELPQVVGYEGAYDSLRNNDFADQGSELLDADEVFSLCRSIEVREAIEAAGLKVKP
ncbi:hypothetical protein [Pseudomonas laurylsulfatiphila]